MSSDVLCWLPDAPAEDGRVVVITVSCNTKELTALLLWSLYRVLQWRWLEVVVVDNGSHDGSLELLVEAQEAGFCSLIGIAWQRAWGRATTQSESSAQIHWADAPGPAASQDRAWLSAGP